MNRIVMKCICGLLKGNFKYLIKIFQIISVTYIFSKILRLEINLEERRDTKLIHQETIKLFKFLGNEKAININ